MQRDTQNTASYIIIGAGNFGSATALTLKTACPRSEVTLVDSTPFPNPRAASHDINKIVRDDYPEAPYMEIMVRAMKSWNENPLYAPYFNKTGYLRVDNGDFSKRAVKTYKELGVENGAGWLSTDEVRKRFVPLATTNFDGADKAFWLPHAGWANAVGALTAVIEAAIAKDVKYLEGSVNQLLINEDGSCKGVQLASGQIITSDYVLLAAGANTGVVLANTFPAMKSMQAGARLKAAGAVSFSARVHGEQREKFRNVPVIKSCLKHTDGEAMSMTADGVLKFNMAKSFTNNQTHEPSGQQMSVPDRDNPARFTWTKAEGFPASLQERCYKVMRGLYGEEANDLKIESYRICWDAETPFHDFTISPHTGVPNLYVATGGSFHGWKFLPVIGDLIFSMMQGKLEPVLAALWSWNAQIGPDAETNRIRVLGECGSLAMSGHGYGETQRDISETEMAAIVGDGRSDSDSVMSFRGSSDEEELDAVTTKTDKHSLANPTYHTEIDLAELLANYDQQRPGGVCVA